MFRSRNQRIWLVIAAIYPFISLSILLEIKGSGFEYLFQYSLGLILFSCVVPSILLVGLVWIYDAPGDNDPPQPIRYILEWYKDNALLLWRALSVGGLLVLLFIGFEDNLEAYLPAGRIDSNGYHSPRELYGNGFMSGTPDQRRAYLKLLREREKASP
jgi:hypothetical protein